MRGTWVSGIAYLTGSALLHVLGQGTRRDLPELRRAER